MSWASVDDGFADHPKVLPLSSHAFRLHVCAMCWCNRRGTDGVVLTSELRILAGMLPEGLDVRELVAELVASRLWDTADDGWALHDFLDWNEPAAKVKAKRDAHAQRQKEAREKARAKACDAARDIARAPSPSPPLPSPINSLTPARTQSLEPDPQPVPLPPTRELDDNAAAAWNAIERGAGGPQGLGLQRNYGKSQPLWLDDNRAVLWVQNWYSLRQAKPPPSLADCEKLGRWIAAGGPGEIKSAWQMLSKGGAAPNVGAWLDAAHVWDGVSDLRSRGPAPRVPDSEQRSTNPIHHPAPLTEGVKRLRAFREEQARAAAATEPKEP